MANVLKMHNIKSIYDKKLFIRQKELENISFSYVMDKVIQLQSRENFCRIKENIGKFDIVSRILRKDNFMNMLVSFQVVDLHVKVPFCYPINFMTNHVYTAYSECLMDYAFRGKDTTINNNFYRIQSLRVRMLVYMCVELTCIIPKMTLKLLFWIFKSAENIHAKQSDTNERGLMQKIFSCEQKLLFRNYNELPHHYELRLSQAYGCTEQFLSKFNDRKLGLVFNFIALICGAFMLMIFLISLYDEVLISELKLFNYNLLFMTVVIASIISFSKSNSQAVDEFGEYVEDPIDVKLHLYRSMVRRLINIPEIWSERTNFTSKYNKIIRNYNHSIVFLVKELLSMIMFPYLWVKLILQVDNVVRFIKLHFTRVEGIGDIVSFSIVQDLSRQEQTWFNLRKQINSYFAYYKNYGYIDNEEETIEQSIAIKDNGVNLLKRKLYEVYANIIKENHSINFNILVSDSAKVKITYEFFCDNLHYCLSEVKSFKFRFPIKIY